MLRSASPAFVIGAAIAFVEAIVSGGAATAASGLGLAVLAVLSLYEGQKRSRWAQMHTFECAAWMSGADLT